MTILQAAFLAVSTVGIAGALGVVLSRNVVYAALCLLIALLAVAGIFILIFSPFLALVQILIYGGAVIVVVLFALMLTRDADTSQSLDNAQKPLAFIVGLAAMAVLIATILRSAWPKVTEIQQSGFRELGLVLFSQWAVPFEVASLLLLVALIGAIIIARPGETE